jgi:hypothetical protein
MTLWRERDWEKMFLNQTDYCCPMMKYLSQTDYCCSVME